ncbi:hypothetical protein [Azospirillum sp. B4]|uniref:hypothetical protein n=1 Tax=Azospirillum sp. B4 TaxID=95605 RepID=UPI00034A6403|nr:hypothetical protein [Azospirillum sp. B4]
MLAHYITGAPRMANHTQINPDDPSSILHIKGTNHAVLLDLSGVADAYEPVIHRIVNAELKAITGDAASDLRVSTYRVGDYGWLLIGGEDGLPALLAAADRISHVFADAHQGKVDVHWFILPQEAKPLAACLRLLAGERSAPPPPPALNDVTTVLQIERALHNADLSSLIRRDSIHQVDKNGTLTPVMMEQTVDLEALEKMFTVNILKSPWMLARVTEILDQRMLRHLLHQEPTPRMPIAIKLHAGTVRHADFNTLLDELPAYWHARLVIELPYAEWRAAPAAVEAALAIGRKRQCMLALDNIPADLPPDTALPDDVLLRFTTDAGKGAPEMGASGMGAGLGGPGMGHGPATLRPHAVPHTPALKALIHRLGVERCILTHCDSLALVRQGLDAGFRLLQGPAVTDFVEMRRELPANAPADKTPAAEETDDVLPEDGTPDEKPPGFWARLRRWLHRPAAPRKDQTPREK